MESAIERFRNRQNTAMVLEVPISPGSTELIFKVKRFAEEEHNAARKDAEAVLVKLGMLKPGEIIDREHPAFGRYLVEFCEVLPKYIKRHIKGWTHNPKDEGKPVDFTPGALEGLISGMSSAELSEMGLSYLNAVGAEEKKKESATSSEPSSSNGSENASSTS